MVFTPEDSTGVVFPQSISSPKMYNKSKTIEINRKNTCFPNLLWGKILVSKPNPKRPNPS